MACGERNTERRTDFAVEGIDVSRYQAEVDWAAVADAGIAFAYVKATEGAEHADARFCDNWQAAAEADLVRGAYHFYRADVDAVAQADNFYAYAEPTVGDLPPVLDVETLDGATRAQLITGIRTWLYLAEVRTGVKPILYTNLAFYYRHLAGHFDDYPLWIARYGTREPSVAAGAQLAFWQYGDRGRIDGIDGAVDLNVFFGTAAEFEALRICEPEVLTQRLW